MTAASPAILKIAIDLTRSLGARDRYAHLLDAVRSLLPCDATALLALQGDTLVPLACHGLAPRALEMRFRLADHPRLAHIVASGKPVRFPSNSALPDPFDGLVAGAPHALDDVHDCLGCPLLVDGKVVGVLTADALLVGAFDALNPGELVSLSALAGAALHTTMLIDTIERLADKRGQVVAELTREDSTTDTSSLIGVSESMDHLRKEIETVAHTDLTVLVVGETGVGKELAARALHAGSEHRNAPLIHVNCAALPESIVESELFGHVRGAFTGALTNRLGKFELADGGSLFLDEIGELPLSIQPKLLRALQEGEIQRVGSDESIVVNVRIIAATNRKLENEVAAGRFRADLYHRLNVYPIRVPPLREHREDIGVLAGFFLDRYRSRLGLGQIVLSQEAAESLRTRQFPGNVRELDHVLARAALRAAARGQTRSRVQIEMVDLDTVSPSTGVATPSTTAFTPQPLGDRSLRDAVDDFKRQAVQQALDAAAGNWAEAARRLGMHRGNLHHLARRLNM